MCLWKNARNTNTVISLTLMKRITVFPDNMVVLFGVIVFSCSVTRASALLLRSVNYLASVDCCDVALVLRASSLAQKSLFGWHRSCCFIHCMSLYRSLRTRRISLIKPSSGYINGIASSHCLLNFHHYIEVIKDQSCQTLNPLPRWCWQNCCSITLKYAV